jgi:mxaD protein
MIYVEETVQLRVEPEVLWRQIGSFSAVGTWHPLLDRAEGEGEIPGTLRRLVTNQGDVQVERLESMDPSLHVYRYSLEQHSLPVTSYTGEFRIDGTVDGGSDVTWLAHFDTAPGAEEQGERTVRDFIVAGLENLAAVI